MTARIGRTILPLVGFVALVMVPSAARAQGNTFNPYGNSGYADYREYGSPVYSGNTVLPGEARVNGTPLISKPRANSYQEYTAGLEGSGTEAGSARRSASNLPYYQAYQQLNSQYNRVYRPNDTPENRRFEERLKQRDAAYAKALEERNPVKRAKLLKEVEQGSFERSSSTTRPRTTAIPNTVRPSQPATTSRAPDPYSTAAPLAPGERRSFAPSPSPSGTARRPSAIAPASRAPASPRTGAGATSTPTPRTNSPIGPAPDPSTFIPPPR